MKKDFNIIYDELKSYVYYFILKRCGNPTMSEDFTSEVMIKIYRNYDNFDAKDAHIFSYARFAAKNRLIDHWKKKKMNIISIQESLYEDSGSEVIQIADGYLNPIQEMVNKELGEVIDEAINTLSEEYVDTVRLYFIDQQKMKDIAELINVKENTIKTRIHKSRKKLQDVLSDTWNSYIENN